MTNKQKADKLSKDAEKLFKNFILIAEEQNGVVYGYTGGNDFDGKRLVNIIAVACDNKITRELLYQAVKLDIEHDALVGRHPTPAD